MAQRPSKQLNVSELDFDQIKSNLKEFLRSQDNLQDYDFEGSALSTLLDVMAYVTHYNAVNANIGINETFLETAQSRGSVVGHARQLSYTPKSATGAVGAINVQIENPSGEEVILDTDHKFTSTIDGETYTFYPTQTYTTTTTAFTTVQIRQGDRRTTEYIFDVDTSERFLIPEVNVDTSTLEVRVYDSIGSTDYSTFVPVKNINEVTSESKVYYLSEGWDGRYDIRFGDGVLGQSLVNGNRVEIRYLVTDGSDGNNAARFSSINSITNTKVIDGVPTNFTYGIQSITTSSVATGGTGKESIRSIKYNAPLTFLAQNRAVTPDDYRAIIFENFSNANSVVVWGGEDNDPPEYGKAFVSIIPKVGETLSTSERDQIINQILRPKCVVSVTPELVDPEYTYVALEVFYKRNSSESTRSFGEITTLVQNAITDYNNTQLRKFDGVLRYSALLGAIDTAEKSIVNSTVRVYMKKRFVPVVNESRRYELNFSSRIYDTQSTESVIYRSSIFTFNGEQCRFQDYLNSDNQRRIRIVRGSGVNQITVANDVGFVDALGGKIVLTNFNPSAFNGAYIELTVIPNSNDIAPKRNNIVAIDSADVIVSGASDTISTGSASGGLSYDSIPRHA